MALKRKGEEGAAAVPQKKARSGTSMHHNVAVVF
jgi:hypothetical protein